MKDSRPTKKILALEVNELPWEIVDWAISTQLFPSVTEYFLNSLSFSSTFDYQGELSPWSTWPTMHRGLKIEDHKIMALGQDINTFNGITIWDKLIGLGYSVGVCGSLQSWPPRDPGQYGFYLPDTFAPTPSAIPTYLEKFQKFNLSMVRASGRKPRKSDCIDKLGILIASGLGPNGYLSVAKQVCKEVIGISLVEARTTTQSFLSWDIFKREYTRSRGRLAYASWFTNNIASVMHRHWDQLFPLEYENLIKTPKAKNVRLFKYAFTLLDSILSDAMQFAKKDENLIIILSSSMGQSPVKVSSDIEYSVVCRNLERFAGFIMTDLSGTRANLAMVPQISFSFNNQRLLVEFNSKINSLNLMLKLENENLVPLIDSSLTHGNSLSLTLSSRLSSKPVSLQFCNVRECLLSQLGMVAELVDTPSAYHVPSGIVTVYGNSIKRQSLRSSSMQAKDYKDFVIGLIEGDIFPGQITEVLFRS